MQTHCVHGSFLKSKYLIKICKIYVVKLPGLIVIIYTSQQKKRYKGSIHMGIGKKTITTKFFNIIIRTNYGQIEIVMQYGGLRSSVTCVTTSCRNDSFAYLTHRTNQSLYKGLWDVVPPVHK